MSKHLSERLQSRTDLRRNKITLHEVKIANTKEWLKSAVQWDLYEELQKNLITLKEELSLMVEHQKLDKKLLKQAYDIEWTMEQHPTY